MALIFFFIKTCALQLHVKQFFMGQMTAGVLQDIKDCQIHPCCRLTQSCFTCTLLRRPTKGAAKKHQHYRPNLTCKVLRMVLKIPLSLCTSVNGDKSCEGTSSATGHQLHLYTDLHMQCYNVSLLLMPCTLA